MENKSIVWFYKKLQKDNQCLLYNGSFNDKITYKIVGLTEANLKNRNESFKTQKRVSYLMAECFQNIIRHGDDSENKEIIDRDSSFFMTRNYLGKYYILSGNLIKNDNINSVKSQIDQLNTLDKDELKALHKQVLKNGKLSDKGGAGLGMIDMARKSGHKLGYHFKKYNANSSIFYNQIVLKSDIESDDNQDDNMMGIDAAIHFHELLVKDNILMIQKGDFSQESIIPVLNIIERSIIQKSSKSMTMKNLYRTMVELLQNISRHAYSETEFKEGIFLLSKKNEKYSITTGNYIQNSEIETLKNHIEKINSSGKDELENWYSELLLEGVDNDDNYAGMGLIDLAQLISNNYEYAFESIDNNRSFFTIKVCI